MPSAAYNGSPCGILGKILIRKQFTTRLNGRKGHCCSCLLKTLFPLFLNPLFPPFYDLLRGGYVDLGILPGVFGVEAA